MSAERTPKRSANLYAQTVHRLNFWNLNLPSTVDELINLNEERRIDLDDEEKPLRKRCANHVRFLSWRPEWGLETLLDQYDESVKATYRKWKYKPSQEPGTLLSMQVTKSFIVRDVASKVERQLSTAAKSQVRKEMLTSLEELLGEIVKLARDSDGAFQLTAGPPHPRTEDLAIQPITSPKRPRVEPSQIPGISTKKKRKIADLVADDKNSKSAAIKDEAQRSIPSMFSNVNRSNETLPSLSPSNTTPRRDASSANSSFIDNENTVHDYFPSQDAEELCQEESFRRSLHSFDTLIEAPNTQTLISQLLHSGPLRNPGSAARLPKDVPFRYRYELYRVAQTMGWAPLTLWTDIIRMTKDKKLPYDAFWAAIRAKSAGNITKLPERSDSTAFEEATGSFQDNPGGLSVSLSGNLDWSEASENGLFKLQLEPLKLEKSCRFHRRFGSDRFMVLRLPLLDSPPSDSRRLKDKKDELRTAVSEWLGSTPHYIIGRYWRAFYTEVVDQNGKKARKSISKPKCIRINLFAVDGEDFLPRATRGYRLGGPKCTERTPVSMEEFTNWHIPIEENVQAKNLKTFQRFQLGLSKTTSSITLEPNEFIHLADRPEWKLTMNDGCASMSMKLAAAIADAIGLDYVPTAFQGRISGAKGLWMVERADKYPAPRGYWIEVSDSQLKISPHPKDRPDADLEQRTFEVLKHSGPTKEGHLNVQFILALAYGGVKRAKMESYLREEAQKHYQELREAMEGPERLAAWNQKGNDRKWSSFQTVGAFPDERVDQINLLLTTGFNPRESEILFGSLRDSLEEHMKRYVDKLRIQINQSTFVYCVADPYGVLEPGQVHLSLSRPMKDPATGRVFGDIDGLSCVVTRNPCHFPSDIQKVRGVWKSELRHFKDVAVFPTTGDVPLASILSGGDYDGDTVFICWDQSLIENFNNSPTPKPTKYYDHGLLDDSEPLSNFFHCHHMPRELQINKFLTTCFHFNLEGSLLGLVSSEHEKVVYNRGLSDSGALKLAALAGFLVDGCKQGYSLSWKMWYRIQNQVIGKEMLVEPAYKSGILKDRKGNNVIDYLKLVVAEDEKNRILSQFAANYPQPGRWDKVLSARWNKALDQAKDEAKRLGRPEMQQILSKLKQDVEDVGEQWSRNTNPSSESDKSFTTAVNIMHDSLLAIEPLHVNHALSEKFSKVKSLQYSYWTKLRASCFYHRFYRTGSGRLPFLGAGFDLCRMKAKSTNASHMITLSMYHLMKIDSKAVKRALEKKDPEDIEAAPLPIGSGSTLQRWLEK